MAKNSWLKEGNKIMEEKTEKDTEGIQDSLKLRPKWAKEHFRKQIFLSLYFSQSPRKNPQKAPKKVKI